MVIISKYSYIKDPSVHQDEGNTGRISMAHFISSDEKKEISFTSYYPVKVPYHTNLSTIIEEKEMQVEYEKRNDLSTGLSRSKRSLHSGLSALALASEKLIEAASDCWATSSHTEISDEDRSFSCEWPINGEDSYIL
jgi:hypothetical protein